MKNFLKTTFAFALAFLMTFAVLIPTANVYAVGNDEDPEPPLYEPNLKIINSSGERINGATYTITQTKGDYNAETGEFDAPTMEPFDVTIDPESNVGEPNEDGTFAVYYLGKGEIGLYLPKGTYEIIEKSPAPGYNSFKPTSYGGTSDDQPVVVELPQTNATGDENSDHTEVMFKTEDTRVNVSVLKKDGDNNDVALAGATFKIQKEEENAWTDYDMNYDLEGVQAEIVTGEDGIALFRNLPAGKYRITETAVPEGYVLNTTAYEFEVVSDDTSDMTLEDGSYKFKFEHTNFKEPAINKKVNDVEANETPLYVERQEEFIYTLEIDLPKDIGSYKNFVVTDASQHPDVQEMTLPTDIKLNDVDVASLFTVESDGAGGVKLTGKVNDPNWKTTMVKGKLVIKVPAKLTDNSVPLCALTAENKYESGCHKNTFKLDYKNQFDVTGEPESNETHVDPKNAKLIVKKTQSDGTTLLAGAEFKLEPIAGTAFKDANKARNTRTGLITSDDLSNLLTIENLDAGTYALVETKAPEGYRLLGKAIKVELEYAENAVEVEVERTVKNYTQDEWYPDTGTSLALGFALVGGGAILTSIIMKKKKEEE